MDNTRPTPTGNVESTPEAGPLTPPTMRDHFADPIQGQQSAAAQAGTTSTPEAVVTAAASTSTGATEQPTASSGHQATGGPGGTSDDWSTKAGGPPREELDPEAIAKDVATRLKPVVEAAEDVATKALDLSAKGLSKLVDMLEERRRHRAPNEPTDPS